MYNVTVTRHFYGPYVRKSSVLDERTGEPKTYATKAAAQTDIDELEDGIYYTDHNESGRPDYKIVRAKRNT